ncbi:TIGR02206 family membrane protein [Paenibacillus alvei]|uniref:TIGR02206 family membrane protein n=1 Tax=Paenibacillus alvei TaxID=44250 RepID=A0AAP7DI75_PAEAL|nr:TIGR02206 family membrane protein [Paenibacillus alvei]NEZ43505.1 TIGR02206 family membrane protein [Paenibacillus alvei]NOJ70344.1 TIGR02206 family membrane protein [Paenibacillus alvei]
MSWFSPQITDTFQAFSASHFGALLLFISAVLLFYRCRHWLQQEKRNRCVRYVLLGLLILSEAALNIWYLATGIFHASNTLPFELCSISLYMCVLMLFFRSKKIFQIVYFTGIAGALQALLTPALDYPFPHFRFIQFFLAHIAIILAVLYMVWVEHAKPTWKSIGYAMLFLNVLLVVVGGINYITGGNYMFLAHKPETASLLDVLGPYPWYLLSLEAVAFGMFIVLYLPFLIAGRLHRSSSSEIHWRS